MEGGGQECTKMASADNTITIVSLYVCIVESDDNYSLKRIKIHPIPVMMLTCFYSRKLVSAPSITIRHRSVSGEQMSNSSTPSNERASLKVRTTIVTGICS